MMLYPSPATTWQLMYSWNRHEKVMTEINCPNNNGIARPPCLSQSVCSSRKDSGGGVSQPITPSTALKYIHHSLALAKIIMQSPPTITPTIQEPSSQQWQWENMCTFHSSNLLWPSKEWKSQTWMESGLPLIWTMLYPPPVEGRLQTYAWTGHLENYMPWKIGQTGMTA